MKYDEKLARKLVEQHQLSASAIKQWRRRGRIPDKYSPEINFERQQKIKKVLAIPWINVAHIAYESHVGVGRLENIVSKNLSLKANEEEALAKSIMVLYQPLKQFLALRQNREREPFSMIELDWMWMIAHHKAIKRETAFDSEEDHRLFLVLKNKPLVVNTEVQMIFQEKVARMVRQMERTDFFEIKLC